MYIPNGLVSCLLKINCKFDNVIVISKFGKKQRHWAYTNRYGQANKTIYNGTT